MRRRSHSQTTGTSRCRSSREHCRRVRSAKSRTLLHRRPKAGRLPSNALSPAERLAQGFFDSPAFPRLESCASDVTDAYTEIKKAIEEIGTRNRLLTLALTLTSTPTLTLTPPPTLTLTLILTPTLTRCEDARQRQGRHQGPGQGVRQPEGAPSPHPSLSLLPAPLSPRPSPLAPHPHLSLSPSPLTRHVTPHVAPHVTPQGGADRLQGGGAQGGQAGAN